MKKSFCLFLAVLFCLGLTSCINARNGYVNSDGSYVFNTLDSELESQSSVPSESSESVTSVPGTESQSDETYKEMPMLWKVSSKDGKSVVWIFPIMHYAKKEIYPLPEEIISAYKKSKGIIIDYDNTNENIDYGKLYLKLAYKDGSTIDKHISTDLYNKALAIVKKEYDDKSISNMKHYSPYLWASTVNGIYMDGSDLNYAYGVDDYFINQAKKDSKRIYELTTAEKEFDRIANLSPKTVELMFRDMVIYCNPTKHKAELEEIYNAWISGDEAEFTKLYLENDPTIQYTKEELDLIDQYKKLIITDVSNSYFLKLKGYLEQKTELFVVAEASSFLGENGIISKLTKSGYNVQRIGAIDED